MRRKGEHSALGRGSEKIEDRCHPICSGSVSLTSVTLYIHLFATHNRPRLVSKRLHVFL